MAGFPVGVECIEDQIFQTIDDYTDDFDSPQDYDTTLRRYNLVASGSRFQRQAVLAYAYSLAACRGFVRTLDRRFLGGLLKRLFGQR
jgi:hypothetical protein